MTRVAITLSKSIVHRFTRHNQRYMLYTISYDGTICPTESIKDEEENKCHI